MIDEENSSKTFSINDSPITIGRSDKCKFYINSNGLSRFQSYIIFDAQTWWIKDGSIDEKKSTNGTWIFAEEEIEILENSIIKAAETIFKFIYMK